MGLPVRLLAPPNWDQLGHEPQRGPSRTQRTRLPISRRGGVVPPRDPAGTPGQPRPGGRACLLAGAAGRRVTPGGGVGRTRRDLRDRGDRQPAGCLLLHGIILFALLAAWLWLPGLERSQTIAAGRGRCGGRAPRAAGGEPAGRGPALARLPELELERLGGRGRRVVRLEPHLRAPRLDANGRDPARRFERCTALLAHRGARPLRRLSLAGDHGQRERRSGAPAQPHRLPVRTARPCA